MSDEGYNGWKNYPTWCVNLWLNNDQGTYLAALEQAEDAMSAQRAYRATMTQRDRLIWTEEESARFAVADRLKDWVTDDLAPDLGASFASDLLDYALGEVDWNEIADAWIESVREQVSA